MANPTQEIPRDDASYARVVRAHVDALNQAMKDAAKAGLRVSIDVAQRDQRMDNGEWIAHPVVQSEIVRPI